MADPSALSRALTLQAQACITFGSPFSGALLQKAAEDVEQGGPTAKVLAAWAGDSARSLFADAVPVRLLGALHAFALSGDAPALTAAYPAPDRPGDGDGAWAQGLRLIETYPERFIDFMGHEPQTNEVRRSACLIGGFLTVAEETGLPLRCFEVGASAGLNQLWDRFHYRLGEAGTWGDDRSPVDIDTDWRGPPPPLAAGANVIERAACDRRPVNIADPAARARLRAYVWADQLDRMQRLEAAIALALAGGVTVEAQDAVKWTAARAAPQAGAATVLYHSVFWQYMPPDSQAGLLAVIGSHGEAASRQAPFAWLRMEPPPNDLANMELRLTLWPGGEERLLARVHPHGAQVNWGVS
jgi:hypothetical protein